jgi:hypothetical protein
MTPTVEGLGVHPWGTGSFSHAFPLWPPADFVYGGSSVGGSQPGARGHKAIASVMVSPLVDRSDRADNIARSGGIPVRWIYGEAPSRFRTNN